MNKKGIEDKTSFRSARHPNFDAMWEKHEKLVWWWAVKCSNTFNVKSRKIWTKLDFIGILTIRFNHVLYSFDEQKGKFTTLFSWRIYGYVINHMLMYESEYWNAKMYNAGNNDLHVGSVNKEFHESDYFMYRVPENDSWTFQIIDLFEDHHKCWRYLTDGLPERSKSVLEGRYKDGKTLVEIGKLMGITKERVRQIQEASVKSIANRLRKLEIARSLFFGDTE